MAAVRVAFPIGLAFLQDDPMPPDLPPSPGNNKPSGQHKSVSPARLIAYGSGAMAAAIGATWVLAEWSTKPEISVFDADLSGFGRTVGLIAAAAVGVPAAVLAYHRQRALDTSNRNTADQHEHKVMSDNREHRSGTERNLRERYTTCAEQLGHDSSAIRLAGVYALASLADDWHDFGNDSERQVCVDLLCAYLRAQRKPATETSTDSEASPPDTAEQNVRSAIVRSIRVRTLSDEDGWIPCTFDLGGADLTGTDLTDVNLTGANLTDADLRGANLVNAHLNSANLVGADLTNADLTDANLTHANLTNANLTTADLRGANLFRADLFHANLFHADLTGASLLLADLTNTDLTGTDLNNANLNSVKLIRAILGGANLTLADLTLADLRGANLTSANLTDANLTDANLTDANLTGADLSGMVCSESTVWPEGPVQRPTSPLESR